MFHKRWCACEGCHKGRRTPPPTHPFKTSLLSGVIMKKVTGPSPYTPIWMYRPITPNIVCGSHMGVCQKECLLGEKMQKRHPIYGNYPFF